MLVYQYFVSYQARRLDEVEGILSDMWFYFIEYYDRELRLGSGALGSCRRRLSLI